ncbi:MAG: phosphotransferase, partial [Proteobacteria bacterium]|nr:phosphotransferase [Pseudomonadota bacterium]
TWELNFFVTKYMEGVCKRPLKGEEKIKFSNDVRSLSKFLSSGSRYFVHRDFHSRNVMVADSKIAVIDFQDARLGPVSYDLVSLCFDSYVPFSKDQRRSLIDRGIEAFEGKFGVQIADECKSQWRPMLLQRQLKAIGSFGYLTVDKHKGDYLKNVAPALETLDPNLVFDSRWPFLSGKLLEILEETLPTKFSSPNKALKT